MNLDSPLGFSPATTRPSIRDTHGKRLITKAKESWDVAHLSVTEESIWPLSALPGASQRSDKAAATNRTKKGRLPGSIRRQTREYATEVLGWSGYADWLQVYATVAGEFREGWIPGNYYSQVVLPSINRKAGEISSIRSLSRHLFRSPHFPDRAHVMNGRLMSPSFRPIPDDAWERTLFRHSNRVVFKPDGGRESSGVMLLDARSLDRERLRTLPDGTLQEFVVQHELFDQIAPGFVTTLRITTVLHPDGQARARAAFLRTGIDPNQHATV